MGKATVVQEERTDKLWHGDLTGKGTAIGVIPINEDNQCKWGCFDVDTYPLDHKELVAKIRKLKLPIVVCRSKSGGAHGFLFTSDWVSAKEMQDTCRSVAAALGHGDCEIFPKQIQLNLERGDVGNFLNIPYFDAEDGLRYAIKDDGSAATLEEFYALYDEYVLTPEQLLSLTVQKPDEVTAIKDGPPCLQTLCSQKISE